MSRTTRRVLVLATAYALAWTSAACVDLFHSTQFELCKTDPDTGACVDASSDADATTDGDANGDASTDVD